METERKSFDYNVGALVILVISIGVAAIVYAAGIVPFNFLNFQSWILGPLGILTFIFGPLGVYTLIYSLVVRRESTYYLVWGTIMFAVAAISALYNIMNVFIVVGILLILLAVIGLIAYVRRKK